MVPLTERLVQTLSRYMSLILARSVVERAVQRAGLAPHYLRMEHLPAVIPLLEAGTRLFVDPARHRELEQELGGFVAAPPTQALVIDVTTEPDIAVARGAAREMAQRLGASSFAVQKVATIVSELARNIVKYTSGGYVEITPRPGRPARIGILSVDRGNGIKNLDEVMSDRYRSRTGLGTGLKGTKRLSSRFEISTGVAGTRVDVEVTL